MSSEAEDSQAQKQSVSKLPLFGLIGAFFFLFLVKMAQSGGGGRVAIAGVLGEAMGMCFIPAILTWRYHKTGGAGYYWGTLAFVGFLIFGQYLLLTGQ